MDKALRNYAKANELTVKHNTASGMIKGFQTTVTKGKDHVRISFSASFDDPVALLNFKEDLYQKSASREYRILEINYLPQSIDVALSYRSTSDIDRVDAFVNYFLPLLRKHNVVRSVNQEAVSDTSANDELSFADTTFSLFRKGNRSFQSN